MATLAFSISASHDFDRGARRIRDLGDEMDGAIPRATVRATNLLLDAAADHMVSRTKMDEGVARRILESETDLLGQTKIGRVRFTEPPERIYPKRKKALAFEIGGRKIVRASVRGSRPLKLLPEAGELNRGSLEEVYEQEVGRAFAGELAFA